MYVGNYITSGDSTGIVVLTQTHPIDVIFTLPEGDIATVLSAQKSGQAVPVEAWDRANQHKLSQGSLLSMDNQIDATTGTIKLKARFENSDDALFPNQFVNVRMQVTTLQNALLVPLSAIQTRHARGETLMQGDIPAGGGPSRLFILRPIATTLLMLAILLAGIIGYRALPVSALP